MHQTLNLQKNQKEHAMTTEAKVIKLTATFQAPNQDGEWVESCFTVSSRDTVSEEERADLINKLAPRYGKTAGITRHERNRCFN